MSIKAADYGLLGKIAASASVEAGQQWILTAMNKHGEQLVSLLWRILGNEQDVCDAYQDTFLQLAHYKSCQKPGNVKAYLFRTASNTAISILRRKKSQSKAIRAKGQFDGKSDIEHIGKSHDLDTHKLQEQLRIQIGCLPEHLRNVVLLRDLAEMSYIQVSGILGISVGTARVYRRRAVQMLAVIMAKENG